jgi:hypothetical protein
MGMNMVSKGVQNVLDFLQKEFPDMDVISVSGESVYVMQFFVILIGIWVLGHPSFTSSVDSWFTAHSLIAFCSLLCC